MRGHSDALHGVLACHIAVVHGHGVADALQTNGVLGGKAVALHVACHIQAGDDIAVGIEGVTVLIAFQTADAHQQQRGGELVGVEGAVLQRTPILHNTFYLIVSPEHPLTGRSALALADLAGQQLFYEPLYQEMVDLAVVQPGLPFSAPSWHMVENYECVYNDLLAGRGMFLCPMKYPAFPAAWYLPLQLPLPDTCLLTLRDDPRPEIQRLREVFTAVYASRAKLLGEE